MKDFYTCEFIEKEMWFHTFNDFCDARHGIKQLYKQLDNRGRRMYMWYVYANVHMNEQFKNYVWDYLNDYMNEADIMYKKRFYKVK